MSALRAFFKSHLPLAGIRLSTHSIATFGTNGSQKHFMRSSYSALSCLVCRSLSTVHSTDKVKSKLNNEEEEVVNDEPVKFTSSKAADWKAEFTWRGVEEEMPESQPVIVSLSIGVFLLYFLVLREENDIDQKLVSGLEDLQ